MRRVPDPSTFRPFDSSTPRPRRRGFTLVELLMVILILAGLIALLIPAFGNVRSRVLRSNVRTEISNIENAIAAFRSTFGVEPPSRLVLCQNLTQWNANPESKAFIRRLWPGFNFGDATAFSGTGGLDPSVFNNNAAPITLYGDECLVFFLAGVTLEPADPQGNGFLGRNPADPTEALARNGFSNNPAQPFLNPTGVGAGQTRKGPFLEFDTDRLVPSATPGHAHIDVYVDSLAARSGFNAGYIYLSSRDGRGYFEDGTTTPPSTDAPPGTLRYVYKTASGTPYKPKSFQIISPGPDGQYGIGGIFDPNNLDSNNTDANGNPIGLVGQLRSPERDNLTNFSDGFLGD